MQTFLPHENFVQSAKWLDRKRLGKQRVECLQLLQALAGIRTAWANHPACVMWRGHELSLYKYGEAVCAVWGTYGYKDTCLSKMRGLMIAHFGGWARECSDRERPPWLGWDAFHASHRSNLLRKNPEHYGQFGWADPNDLPYIWPTKFTKETSYGIYQSGQLEH